MQTMPRPFFRFSVLILSSLSFAAYTAEAETPTKDAVSENGEAGSASSDASSGEPEAETPSFVTPSAVSVPEAQLRDWAEDLRSVLERQLELLTAIDSSASASASVAPIRTNLQRMDELQQRVRADALRLYLDNTPAMKMPFIELLQRTAIEFKRLEDADCYGCSELSRLLAPQTGL